jgi:hypothetical protein
MARDRPHVLTLRFRNPVTRELLGFVAAHRHTSMNAVAEAALQAQLRQDAAVIERELQETLGWLRRYAVDAHIDQDADAFARAEVDNPDPLRSERAETAPDPLGLSSHFV